MPWGSAWRAEPREGQALAVDPLLVEEVEDRQRALGREGPVAEVPRAFDRCVVGVPFDADHAPGILGLVELEEQALEDLLAGAAQSGVARCEEQAALEHEALHSRSIS